MKLPRIPQRGQPIDVEWGQDVARCIAAIFPRPSADVLPNVSPGGTTYGLSGSNGGKKTVPGSPIDFSIYDAGASGGTAQLGVRNGNVQLNLPLQFGDGIGPMPDGMGAAPYKIAAADSDNVAYLSFTIDNSDETVRTVTALAIVVGDSVPVPDDDTMYYIPLGTFAVNDNKSITILSGESGIGSITVGAARNWFSNPVTYSYAPGPL